ncbi:MAG: enoyl-CoA hydratase [Gemmatimonadales bacterium]|nr:MAG: enoyl-CoA hydratase [Gemmatimonadales bacterium]
MEYVRLDVQDRIATVTIDRQEKLNALNPDVIRELGEAFDDLRDREDVGAVVLTGAGEKSFVAGADIGVLAEMDSLTGVEVSRQGQEVFRAIETFPRPVIAAVGGFALGGGCELAMCCHLRVASDNAVFGLPEVGLGIIPGYGGTIRLARLVGLGRALELTLTGMKIDAAAAERMGLVNRVTTREELPEAARKLAGKIARNGPVALQKALEAIYHGIDTSTAEAMNFESSLFGLLASTDDMREGMTAFLEKRRPEFRGS